MRLLALVIMLAISAAGCRTAGRDPQRATDSPRFAANAHSDAVGGGDLPRRHYACGRTSASITVDGRLDDPAWWRADWSDAFVDIEGLSHPRPTYETRMKMLWDDQYLYVAAWLEEPHVWGTLTAHDSIVFHDNDFEVFIDPDGDAEDYFEIEINALGTIFDLFLPRAYRDGGKADHDWNVRGLRSAVHVEGTLNDAGDEDRGWSVEMAIPFAALAEQAGVACPPQAGDTWRINFSRVEWRHRVVNGDYEVVPDTPENNWVWSPQGKINMHMPERWGTVRFEPRPTSGSH